MSVVFKFIKPPSIKKAPPDVLQQFMGLEVPIDQLEIIGKLGEEKSSLGEYPDYRFNEGYVVVTKESLVLAAFSQKKYKLGLFLNQPFVIAERFTVEKALVAEV